MTYFCVGYMGPHDIMAHYGSQFTERQNKAHNNEEGIRVSMMSERSEHCLRFARTTFREHPLSTYLLRGRAGVKEMTNFCVR